MPQFAGGFQAGALMFSYGPYDGVVLSDGPYDYWPLGAKDAADYGVYDDVVLADSPYDYWPLDAIVTV